MPKSPFQNWLTIQEQRRNHIIFLVEWISIFVLAWMFWRTMFLSAPGSVPPGLAAIVLAALYATSMIYGRLLRATGCRKCASALPFLRRETGRRHLHDDEQNIELEYGGASWEEHFVHVYRRISRNDMVAYRCRRCGQAWEEKIELPGSGHRFVRRIDLKK